MTLIDKLKSFEPNLIVALKHNIPAAVVEEQPIPVGRGQRVQVTRREAARRWEDQDAVARRRRGKKYVGSWPR